MDVKAGAGKRGSPQPPEVYSPSGATLPLKRQLAEATIRAENLRSSLQAAEVQVEKLKRRIAVEELTRAMVGDPTVQEYAQRLETVRLAFEKSLQPPADFEPSVEGEYEDTDDFGDVREVEKAVDAAIVKAMELAANEDATIAESGLRLLCCVTHFVARVSEFVDDGGERLGETVGDVLEDLRSDVAESWKEAMAAPLPESERTRWRETALGLLDECGGYYAEAAEVLAGWR
jgi:hypothetical protein